MASLAQPSTSVTSSKRRRATESESDHGALTFITSSFIGIPSQTARSAEFWFEDGNIIIQAEKTQFRVYRGVLSRHSVYFKNLFGEPESNDKCLVDGCSVVRVSGTEVDWCKLLQAIHDFSQVKNASYSWPQLISLLRLGHAYQFDEIRSAIIAQMSTMFPSQLHDWDNALAIPIDPKVPPVYLFEVAKVAIETGQKMLLPALYLQCLRTHGLEIIYTGLRPPSNPVLQLSTLPAAVQSNLSVGRERLLVQSLELFALYPLKSPDGDDRCTNPAKCTLRRTEATARRMAQIVKEIFPDNGDVDTGFCDYCTQIVVERKRDGRKRLWDALTYMFGLPVWTDLVVE
ncbi:hypothetical protein JR316_0005543 [Psilocybe cubensis]|uniref:Uncharacterized protein n=2 Tax=Psilocybe cubensis TaxID=181762 RepID=A0ACB8H185_PSICU|nr:hypothetical protein JR316_0005543 [Psilocybe cubensis]KAH9481024.1 hypothetical protein JR316_0005543 [Psilocybe cubensis]